jgi:group II intron reverse transcriptase/maturase
VDGETAEQFEQEKTERLRGLLERAKSGTYRAPPVRRAWIPKGDGQEHRPIGIPTLEDKVLQRAVTDVLEAIYEQDFYDFSYGFRRGKSPQQGQEHLRQALERKRGGWVLDVDVRKFFDTMDHGHLREFLSQRVRDGVLRRLIDKWLKAGVLEEGHISRPKGGSPQGGVISPMLANVYLHHVLDEWFEEQVKPKLKADAELVRFADDFVIVFEREEDARRVESVLPRRFERFGLTVHPEKTRLVDFRHPLRRRWEEGTTRVEQGETFDFLGFTHHWGRSRRGRWVVRRRTAKDRVRRTLRSIAAWCRANRHRPLVYQWSKLRDKLKGHYGYYGVTGNYASLRKVWRRVQRIWKAQLSRRSWHGQAVMNWARFRELLRKYPLPAPRVVHSIYRT